MNWEPVEPVPITPAGEVSRSARPAPVRDPFVRNLQRLLRWVLGIGRTTLYRKLHALGIDDDALLS